MGVKSQKNGRFLGPFSIFELYFCLLGYKKKKLAPDKLKLFKRKYEEKKKLFLDT